MNQTPLLRRARRMAAAALLVVTAAACADDGDEGITTPSYGTTDSSTQGSPDATALDGERPPLRAESLEPLYGEALAELGMRLTPRGGLVDRSNGGYVVGSPTGTHLALYVEPVGDRSMEEFVDGIVDVTRVFAPDVFERWPELESFDVCQEPQAAVDDSDEPVPVTQIELSRAQSDAIDWSSTTVRDLYDRSRSSPPQLRLALSTAITSSDAFRAATEG